MSTLAIKPQEAFAHLKFARIGPRKLRRVADAIRGKTVREALVLLQFAGVFAAEPMAKLLKSAVANAENNHDMSSDGLFITKVTVDSGPGGGFTKRLDPRAQGRANFKRKRLAHVTIAVGATPPKRQFKQRSGAAIGMRSIAQRQTTAATTRPTTRTRTPKAAAPVNPETAE